VHFNSSSSHTQAPDRKPLVLLFPSDKPHVVPSHSLYSYISPKPPHCSHTSVFSSIKWRIYQSRKTQSASLLFYLKKSFSNQKKITLTTQQIETHTLSTRDVCLEHTLKALYLSALLFSVSTPIIVFIHSLIQYHRSSPPNGQHDTQYGSRQ
jgi:hypothetical protein